VSGLLGGSDHGSWVLNRRGDGLLAQHVHTVFERRYRIPGMVAVLGANHHGVHRLEQPLRVLKETNAEPAGSLRAARSVVVRYPDEVGGVEGREYARVRWGVDVGEAHHTDLDAHPRPPRSLLCWS
jgi:hypothetical protein